MIRSNEKTALAWSFIYFFCLLSAYYILRPIRDEMGIAGGVDNLHWMFTGTFLAMMLLVPIFGWLTKYYPRRKFLPVIYIFFILNTMLFYWLYQMEIPTSILAPSFFIWLSVFNLFVVSVFWSFMSDIFSTKKAKRLYGVIASGGSAGAITGPVITTMLVGKLGPVNLLPISALFLSITVVCIYKLRRWSNANRDQHSINSVDEHPLGGNILAGAKSVLKSKFLMGIGLLVFFYTTVSTFLYFQQAHLIEATFSEAVQRIKFFSSVDLVNNILAVSTQLFLTGKLIKKAGLTLVLTIIPFLVLLGFVGLTTMTILPLLVIIQVIHRAGNFSLLRPGKEILFTLTSREDRYKAKNFIDTTLYRGGDTLTGWAFAGLTSFGLGLGIMAIIAVPFAFAWMVVAFYLGRKQNKLDLQNQKKFSLVARSYPK